MSDERIGREIASMLNAGIDPTGTNKPKGEIPKWKAARCKWCAAGSRASVDGGKIHKIYPMNAGSGGFRHPSVTGRFSEYFQCTAPTEAGYISELEARLAGNPE